MIKLECPFCKKSDVITGDFTYGLSGESEIKIFFKPYHINNNAWTLQSKWVPVSAQAYICKSCGKVWGQTDIYKLQSVLNAWGTDEIK